MVKLPTQTVGVDCIQLVKCKHRDLLTWIPSFEAYDRRCSGRRR
jgi:hypothetical protein